MSEELTPIRAGERRKLYCLGCSTEYEIVYEPKVRKDGKDSAKPEPRPAPICPFCGSEFVEE